ncbi:MAG: HAD-IA family hydrolase [Beijerinckiaceae bacterium]
MNLPNSTSPRKLILFDLDGTLVDGLHSVYATFSAIIPKFGFAAPSRTQVRAIIGRSLPQAIGDMLGPEAPALEMTEAYKAHFHAMRATEGYSEQLYEGVDATMRRLAARHDLLLGTATGKALRGIHWLVEKHGWQGFFTTLQAADTAASKPSPEMVQNACRETGMAPENTIVFGDSVYDMQMAVTAGAMPVGVSWGYGEPADLLRAGATRIIQSFAEVETVIADALAGDTNDA